MQITPAKVSTLHHYFCCVKLFQPSILKETCKSSADNLHLQVRLLEKWLCFVICCWFLGYIPSNYRLKRIRAVVSVVQIYTWNCFIKAYFYSNIHVINRSDAFQILNQAECNLNTDKIRPYNNFLRYLQNKEKTSLYILQHYITY